TAAWDKRAQRGRRQRRGGVAGSVRAQASSSVRARRGQFPHVRGGFARTDNTGEVFAAHHCPVRAMMGTEQHTRGARPHAAQPACGPRAAAHSQGPVLKKLINDPEAVVAESVAGSAAAHADLATSSADPQALFVSRAGGAVSGKVGIVSGGGSGHEPLHAGFVGRGMLDAAVPGAVFTSPTPDPIQAATQAADGGAGVLHIVKNYTGDVLNFETAAELAELEDIPVKSVVITDDVAVEDSLYTAGRRGVAGTVLVEKIAGAAAERGDDLETVHRIATRVAENVRSMGV